MRTALYFAGTTVGSIAFQASVLLFPQHFQSYAWAVKYVWVLWAIIWVAWLGMYFRHKQLADTQQSPLSAMPNAEASVSHSGNASVTQHFHLGPTAPPPAPSLNETRAQHAITKKQVHVEPLRVEFGRITESKGIWKFSKDGKGIHAALLPMHVDAIKSDPGITLEHAKSHLVFTNMGSGEKIRVAHGCWLHGKTLDYIDISAGETKYIILALFNVDYSSALVVSTNHTDYDFYNDENYRERFDTYPLPLVLHSLEVVLTWGTGPSPEKRIFAIELHFGELVYKAAALSDETK